MTKLSATGHGEKCVTVEDDADYDHTVCVKILGPSGGVYAAVWIQKTALIKLAHEIIEAHKQFDTTRG